MHIKPDKNSKRSVCPFLNSLANYNYINRTGVFTIEQLVTQADTIFNIDPTVINSFVLLFKRVGFIQGDIFDLSKINVHNFGEHDASLVHDDAINDVVNIHVNQTLVKELISFSSDGKHISLRDLARFRNHRKQTCAKNNPNFTYGLKQDILSLGESALLLSVFGDTFKIKISTVQDILGNEKIPDDFTTPKHRTTILTLLYIMIKLKVISIWVK